MSDEEFEARMSLFDSKGKNFWDESREAEYNMISRGVRNAFIGGLAVIGLGIGIYSLADSADHESPTINPVIEQQAPQKLDQECLDRVELKAQLGDVDPATLLKEALSCPEEDDITALVGPNN